YSVRPEPDQIEHYLVQADRVEGLLTRAVETALAEWVAGRKIDDVLLHGKAELPGWVLDELPKRIEPYRLGIRVQRVSVPELPHPDEVLEAFTKVSQADQNRSQLVHVAETEAKQTRATAEAAKYRIHRETEASVQEKRAAAVADANRFEERLRK